MDHIGDKAEIIYLRLELEKLQLEVGEHRARRLAIEEEFTAMEDTWRSREPEIRYVTRYLDRSPYETPMPKQIVKGPVRYVDRFIQKPGHAIIEKPGETDVFPPDTRQPGPFGRLGDFLDRVLCLTKV